MQGLATWNEKLGLIGSCGLKRQSAEFFWVVVGVPDP